MMDRLVYATASFLMLAAIVFSLMGCASEPKTQVVKVAVPVSCVPREVGPEPQYADPDDVLLGMNDGPDRYVLMAAGRLQRNQRLAVVEPVVKACR